METNRVWADLTPGKKQRIAVFFKPDRELIRTAKTIKGYTFVPAAKSKMGSAYWSYPLEVRTARLLREAFPQMELGKQLKAWGYRAVAEETNLGRMAIADTAELVNLPTVAPDIYNFIKGRPYQLADVAFMAACANPVNANAPGGGKTIETIASVFEAADDHWNGPHLILAPVTSMEIVWAAELLHEKHGQDLPVLLASGDKYARDMTLMEAQRMVEQDLPFWLICNPQMAQCKHDEKKSAKLKRDIFTPVYPQLFEIEWNTVVVDEFHKCGMGNPNTITRRGLSRLHAKKKIALSGTPMGGKTSKLWGVLNWAEPDKFNSKWRWFEHYLTVSRSKIWTGSEEKNVAQVGEIRDDRYDEFYQEHAQYLVRRTIREMRADLPEPIRNHVWVEMGPEQEKQYKEFALKAELKIEDEQMNAIGILAEYTRLRQFAIAKQELKRERVKIDGQYEDKIVPYPLGVSCKFDQMYRILDDHGVTADDGSAEDSEKSQEQVVIFSQFTKVVNRIVQELHAEGITATSLSGETPAARRTQIIRDFENRAGAQVLVMNTTAGGVAITLNESDAIIMMDETWTPDDAEQAERRNRENSAVIYYLRTRGTIEEYLMEVNNTKRNVNKLVLDVHRMAMKELQVA